MKHQGLCVYVYCSVIIGSSWTYQENSYNDSVGPKPWHQVIWYFLEGSPYQDTIADNLKRENDQITDIQVGNHFSRMTPTALNWWQSHVSAIKIKLQVSNDSSELEHPTTYAVNNAMLMTLLMMPVAMAPERKVRQKQHLLSTNPANWSEAGLRSGPCDEVMLWLKRSRTMTTTTAAAAFPKQDWAWTAPRCLIRVPEATLCQKNFRYLFPAFQSKTVSMAGHHQGHYQVAAAAFTSITSMSIDFCCNDDALHRITME